MSASARRGALIVATGLAGAAVGALYLSVLWWLSRRLGPGAWAARPWAGFAVLAGTGAAVALIARRLGPSGSVELLVDNIHVRGGERGTRELKALIPASLLCIAAGGGAGPEAPLVQTVGTLGSRLADAFGLGAADKRVLTITGMAAGFTVLFGAPIGAALFALEIPHRRGLEYNEALMPAVVGSLCGYAAFAALTGLGLTPVWRFPAAGSLRARDLLWAAGAGAAAAAVAAAFAGLVRAEEAVFALLPDWVRPVAGGVALGLLALTSPYALTFGEAQLRGLTALAPAAGIFAAMAAAKLAGTTITVSSGWKGGFIIPLFFIGACLGRLGHAVFPGSNEVVLMAALMAAACAGVTKTPLGSMLVVTGMTGVRLLPTTLIATMVALALTNRIAVIASQRGRELPPDAAPAAP
jgi:chloride channel protein, CIC family